MLGAWLSSQVLRAARTSRNRSEVLPSHGIEVDRRMKENWVERRCTAPSKHTNPADPLLRHYARTADPSNFRSRRVWTKSCPLLFPFETSLHSSQQAGAICRFDGNTAKRRFLSEMTSKSVCSLGAFVNATHAMRAPRATLPHLR